jgi:hypothetical protein
MWRKPEVAREHVIATRVSSLILAAVIVAVAMAGAIWLQDYRQFPWIVFMAVHIPIPDAGAPPPAPDRTPGKGEPNSTQEFPDGKGGKTVREYGSDGRAVTDTDYGHDHGAGDPHVHDWDWSKPRPRQPGRPPGGKKQ